MSSESASPMQAKGLMSVATCLCIAGAGYGLCVGWATSDSAWYFIGLANAVLAFLLGR